ncbi:CGNR zinc finger domain-containing protein [Tunturiibacter empetritectus]
MSDTQEAERINPFHPIPAPGFDMETPLQFRLFDPQICGELQDDWLANAVESHGIIRSELDAMIDGKLLRRWKDGAGCEGFLLYTEQQARLAKKLQATGHYSDAELQHIFSEWNEFLEILSVDDFAYDSMEVDDYENWQRRTREMTEFFANDIIRMDDGFCPVPAEQLEAHKADARKQHAEWLRTRDYFATRLDADLKPQQHQGWRKALHEIRFSDEMSRLWMAQPFKAQIEQGYSIEVSFYGWETKNFTETTFRNINWRSTLERFKGTRNEGKIFPLRTPDFNLTENGLELLNNPSPEAYKALYEKYRLDELFALVAERGPAMWECDLSAKGRGACAECSAVFDRTTSSRRYCSEGCRSRAKSRRWRENDPERARRAQAKHYKEAYPGG